MDNENRGYDNGADSREDQLDDFNEGLLASDSHNEWLRFVVDGQDYGINVLQVQEILRAGDITPVSGAAHFVLGVINVRGSIVTVVDARRRLNMPPREEGESIDWIVILDVNDEHVGLVVDEVLEVQVLDDSMAENMQGNNDFDVQGVIETPNGMMILVDANSMAGISEVVVEHGTAA